MGFTPADASRRAATHLARSTDDTAAKDQHAKHEDDFLNDGEPGSEPGQVMLIQNLDYGPEHGAESYQNVRPDRVHSTSVGPALPPIDPLSGAAYVLDGYTEPVAQPVEQLTFNQ